MSKFYQDYVWKEGIPYGLGSASLDGSMPAYKIAMDPYRKRIALEMYCNGKFDAILYDSALFDFRHLKLGEQNAWQKVIVSENEEKAIAQIHNQDDRLVCVETYVFDQGLCLSCTAVSAHGILLSLQRIYYKSLGAAFDGVILFDACKHPVVQKSYARDPLSGEFSELLEEVWDGAQITREALRV